MDEFAAQGDGHVAVLRHNGLMDGMAVYDLGCGCGRTAQALYRSGWQGTYTGADVVPELLNRLARQCRVTVPLTQLLAHYRCSGHFAGHGVPLVGLHSPIPSEVLSLYRRYMASAQARWSNGILVS
jgi:SAM-dependent methyltransferase